MDNECSYPKWIDNRIRKRKFKDLSGEIFGNLTVLYRSTDEIMSNGNKTPKYACQCACGEYVLVRATSLKNGHTSSCKTCNRSKSLKNKNLDNLTGQRFNRWLVLERAESVLEPRGKYATMWKCKCDCGTIRDIRASALKANLTHSCGCYNYDQKTVIRDLYKKRFGIWTVIGSKSVTQFSDKSNRWFYSWLCKCDCGTIKYVSEQSLVTNKSLSCGCTSDPLLEVWTRTFLDKHNVKYIRQKTFKDLKGLGNGLLSYDFAIYEDDELRMLIECQGRQHYEVSEFFGGLDIFKKQIEHDKRKKQYAISLEIPLIEIDYHCKNNQQIENILKPIFKKYNLTKNNK